MKLGNKPLDAEMTSPGDKLTLVNAQLSEWKFHVEKVLAQLASLSDLVNQLDALKRNKLGVLSRPQVIPLLEVKLIQAMEKALCHIQEEK